jgi:hypothetical protein
MTKLILNDIDRVSALRHELSHVLTYLKSAGRELSDSEDREFANRLIDLGIEKVEKALISIDELTKTNPDTEGNLH